MENYFAGLWSMAFFEWEGGVVQKGIFQKVTTPLSDSIEPYLPT